MSVIVASRPQNRYFGKNWKVIMIPSHNQRPFQIIDRDLVIDVEHTTQGRFCLDIDASESFFATGPGWKFWCGALVEDVVQQPTVIFGDLKRNNYEGAFGYAGQPPIRYDNDGNEVPLADGWVMIAFGVEQDGEINFFDWDFRPGDNERSGYPVDWQKSFGDPLWTKTNEEK